MKKRWTVLMCVATALMCVTVGTVAFTSPPPPAVSMLDEFTWTGNGGNDDWDNSCNWEDDPQCSHEGPTPSGTGDNATIPTGGPWAVDLVDVSIGTLTIQDDVTFDRAGTTGTLLEVQKLVLDGSAAGFTITISNAGIEQH